MTIRVEREALLRVITAPSSSYCSSSSTSLRNQPIEDEFVIVELPSKKEGEFFYDDLIPESTDEEEDSLLCDDTVSTTSLSTTDDSRVVSFATDLVTDVWTRERTHPNDVPSLFYSSQETQTFRQEYRLERKVLNELSIDPETFPVDDEDLSNLVAEAVVPEQPPTSTRHSISRVVVLHNDKLETFFNQGEEELRSCGDPQEPTASSPLNASFFDMSAGNNNSARSSSSPPSMDGDFFDNDSFWSGSLTWY